jgi:hypothetical protein
LKLEVTEWDAPSSFFASLTWGGSTFSVTFTDIGSNEITDSAAIAAIVADWSSMFLTYLITRVANSDVVEVSHARFVLTGTYSCTDGTETRTREQRFASQNYVRDICTDGSGLVLRAFAEIGSSFANGAAIHTDPLGACNGGTATQFDFDPDPSGTDSIDLTKASSICLCATGAVGRIGFHIVSGLLPSGMSFDPETGCITGTPDDQHSGGGLVTFGASDESGQTATVTCNFLTKCDTPGNEIIQNRAH